jgi:hypothetical protein
VLTVCLSLRVSLSRSLSLAASGNSPAIKEEPERNYPLEGKIKIHRALFPRRSTRLLRSPMAAVAPPSLSRAELGALSAR